MMTLQASPEWVYQAGKRPWEEVRDELATFLGLPTYAELARPGEASGWGHLDFDRYLRQIGFEPDRQAAHSHVYNHTILPGWVTSFSSSPGDFRWTLATAKNIRHSYREAMSRLQDVFYALSAEGRETVATFLANAPKYSAETKHRYLSKLVEHVRSVEHTIDGVVRNHAEVARTSHYAEEFNRRLKQLQKEFGLSYSQSLKEAFEDDPEVCKQFKEQLKEHGQVLIATETLLADLTDVLDSRRAEAKLAKKNKKSKRLPTQGSDRLPTSEQPAPAETAEPTTTEPEVVTMTDPEATDVEDAGDSNSQENAENEFIPLIEIAQYFERPFETVRGWCRREEFQIYNIAEGTQGEQVLAIEAKHLDALDKINNEASRRRVARVKPHHKDRSQVKPVDIYEAGGPRPRVDSDANVMVKLPDEALAICTILRQEPQEIVQKLVTEHFQKLDARIQAALKEP